MTNFVIKDTHRLQIVNNTLNIIREMFGWGQKASFKVGDYVLLRQKTKHTLDIPARPHIQVHTSGGNEGLGIGTQ